MWLNSSNGCYSLFEIEIHDVDVIAETDHINVVYGHMAPLVRSFNHCVLIEGCLRFDVPSFLHHFAICRYLLTMRPISVQGRM